MSTVAEAVKSDIQFRHVSPEFDAGPGPAGRIGMITLASDHVSEQDVASIIPKNEIALYVSRVVHQVSGNVESLKGMENDLADAARVLLPEVRVDVMAFSCTAGSAVIGEERVAELMRVSHPDARCTNPVTAVKAAFEALGVKRVSVLTPYIDEINREIVAFLDGAGVEIVDFGAFGVIKETEIATISPERVRKAALDLDRAEADAIFISCTGLRAVPVVQAIEDAAGIPVISSNQAQAWHALRLAGYSKPVEGYGRLLKL